MNEQEELTRVKEIFDTIIESKKTSARLELVLDRHGNFSVSQKETMNNNLIFENSLIAKKIKDKEKVLMALAMDVHKAGGCVQNYQDIINEKFPGRKLLDAPDLHFGLNAQWMKDNKEFLDGKKLNEMMLSGTHDSAAYQLIHKPGLFSKWGLFKISALLSQYFPLLRKFLSKWTLTQSYSLYEQLQQGVRSFDLRVSITKSGDFVLTHTFACIEMEDGLKQIRDFLDTNTGEILVLSIQEDFEHRDEFKEEDGDKLLLQLQEKFSDIMFDKNKNNPMHVTYGQMIKNNTRLLLNYHCPYNEYSSDSSSPSRFAHKLFRGDSAWYDTAEKETAYRKLNDQIEKFKNMHSNDKIHNIRFCLTATVNEIKNAAPNHFLPFLKKPQGGKQDLHDMACSMNHGVIETLSRYNKKTDPPIAKFIHLVEFDYPEKTGIIQKIISCNQFKQG